MDAAQRVRTSAAAALAKLDIDVVDRRTALGVLGVSMATLERMYTDGRVPAYRVSPGQIRGRIVLSVREMRAYMRKRKVNVSSKKRAT